MRLADLFESRLTNGTLANGFAKMLEGYHSGHNHITNTCYNWVGSFLRNHPGYDNDHTTVRFWGLKRDPIETSTVVHGDAIAPFNGDEDILGPWVRLEGNTVLISTSKDSDYPKMQLVLEMPWPQLRSRRLAEKFQDVDWLTEPYPSIGHDAVRCQSGRAK